MSTAVSIENPRRARSEAGRLPGLDGMRGIGVTAGVVAHVSYHTGAFEALRGAFFAISMFFVLSGFLITSLLLRELDADGTIALRGFWGRRFRRLMPASLAGVALVLAFSWFAADSSQLATLRGDVAAALTYTTNWRQLFAGQVYANQLGSPTPLLHYWSLAIEEQFYLALPLVLLGAHRLGRGHRHAIPAALAVLAACSAAIVVALATSDDLNPDRMYYGTDTRALEFLAGCLMAVWYRRHRSALVEHHRSFDIAGWIGVAAMVVLWITTDLSDEWIYRGGLQLGIVPAMALVLGAASGGTLGRALSVQPLRQLGRISYGIYILHWPIVLWITPQRTGVDAAPLLAVQLAVTIAAAWLSHALIEDPVALRRLLTTPRSALATAVATSAVLLALTWPIVAHGPTSAFDFDAMQEDLDASIASSADPTGTKVGFFGDSTALILTTGVWSADATGDALAPAGTATMGGCGINMADAVLVNSQRVERPRCNDWPERWGRALQERPADVAVVSIGSDVLPASTDGGPYRTLADPAARADLQREMLRAIDLLQARGAHVVWIRQAPVVYGMVDGRQPDPPWPESDPALMDRYNELVDELPALRPGAVDVLDIGAYLASLPGGIMDTAMRPDLLHLSLSAATDVARGWLRPELEAIARARGLDRAERGAP